MSTTLILLILLNAGLFAGLIFMALDLYKYSVYQLVFVSLLAGMALKITFSLYIAGLLK